MSGKKKVTSRDLLYLNICWLKKIGLRKRIFFGVKGFFRVNFDFRNGCKNEFKNNKENS